ncbi:MAG: hypothetical protein ACXABO_14605 [Promethearchaeota archaeon]
MFKGSLELIGKPSGETSAAALIRGTVVNIFFIISSIFGVVDSLIFLSLFILKNRFIVL